MLISANARGAVIEMNGRREEYQLAPRMAVISQRRQSAVRIHGTGRVLSSPLASINGRSTEMLVDTTGASSVAMSESKPNAWAYLPAERQKKSTDTNSIGFANAYQITLANVQVGAIELTKCGWGGGKGDSPVVLLRMSFLKRVKMDIEGSVLVLRQPA